MLRVVKNRPRLFCDRCGAALPVRRSSLKCDRCGQPRPFPVFDGEGRLIGEQHSDVSRAMDGNLVHRPGELDVRLPAYDLFQKSGVGNENPDIGTVRNFLAAHNIAHQEIRGTVMIFRIPNDDTQSVTTWTDAEGHGFRVICQGGCLRNWSFAIGKSSWLPISRFGRRWLLMVQSLRIKRKEVSHDTSLGSC